MLVIYVDDFKLAGPKANLKQGWEKLRKWLTTANVDFTEVLTWFDGWKTFFEEFGGDRIARHFKIAQKMMQAVMLGEAPMPETFLRMFF